MGLVCWCSEAWRLRNCMAADKQYQPDRTSTGEASSRRNRYITGNGTRRLIGRFASLDRIWSYWSGVLCYVPTNLDCLVDFTIVIALLLSDAVGPDVACVCRFVSSWIRMMVAPCAILLISHPHQWIACCFANLVCMLNLRLVHITLTLKWIDIVRQWNTGKSGEHVCIYTMVDVGTVLWREQKLTLFVISSIYT